MSNIPDSSSRSSKSPLILIIDDDAEIRYSLNRVLSRKKYRVIAASSGEEGINIVGKEIPEVIFLDNRMEGISGLETLQHLRSLVPHTMIILMTAFGTTQTAIEAMKYGAFDYIIKPFNIQKVLSLTESAVKAHRDLVFAEDTYSPLLNSEDYKDGMVGVSDKMQDIFKTIGQVAANDFTVLITGESGTGKELVARCIYRHSHLNANAFMAVNCAAIPENLIESELFGHEKGSFTGATHQRIGTFELCDGGTIFLDEIGDMSLSTQTKILRVLQEGEIQRVGGSKIIKVKVRLIAATNKDLEKMVAEKTFREDLYYRLNVVRIRLPALRERLVDIPQLADFMIQRMGKKSQTKVRYISPEAMSIMTHYPWPGNVRELENVIQRASVLSQGESILVKDLPKEIVEYQEDKSQLQGKEIKVNGDLSSANNSATVSMEVSSVQGDFPDEIEDLGSNSSLEIGGNIEGESSLDEISLSEAYDILYRRIRVKLDSAILQEIEREMIVRALRETGGNQVKTSTILGITRATLRKRIDQFNLKY